MRVPVKRMLTLACGATLLGMTGCKQSVAVRHTEQFIPVAKGTRVEVTISTGFITVEAGRTGMVSINTRRKVRALWRAESKLGDIKVRATKKSGLLVIEGKAPPNTGSKKYHMHLKLTVPPSTPLVLKTNNGHIHLTNLRGDIQAQTKSGELRGRGLTGRLTLSTDEGNIILRGAPRQFQLNTRLGEVRLWLRPETQLDGSSSARAESGPLTLYASSKLHALVTAKATGAKVSCAFGAQSRKPGWLQARLGRGGPKISLYSHKGELQIKRW